jgi:hypothetical protein
VSIVLDDQSTTTQPTGLVLTEGQEKAMQAFFEFIRAPHERVFVLSGYAGCGKTTLVTEILNRLPKYFKTIQLINEEFEAPPIWLSATTNKAAENLASITKQGVSTIHSLLSLRVRTDYKTGKTTLSPTRESGVDNAIVFIDEASYIDRDLFKLIFEYCRNCKIIFIGDPAQLINHTSKSAPVFEGKFPEAHLGEVVRQAKGNPIIDLATQFRNTVNTGEWFQFTPDNHHIQWMPREQFNAAIEQEFTRPDWHYNDSKVLAWTNKRVIFYNQHIRNIAKGNPEFQPGDYAVCNSFVQASPRSLKTDELVSITSISEQESNLGVFGKWFRLNGITLVFVPDSWAEAKKAMTIFRNDGDYESARQIGEQWADLRAAYAQTINKSQGSTYDKVFIDLDDVGSCNVSNQLARMLYVGVSRARHQVILTGDLV